MDAPPQHLPPCPTSEKTFAERWTPVRPKVLDYCIAILRGDRHTAEDITQEVAILANKHFSTFRGEAEYLTWVLIIARHLLGRAARDRRHETARDRPFEEELHSATGAGNNCQDEMDTPVVPPLVEVIATLVTRRALTALQGQVLQLHLHESQLGWAEIGRRLGCGESLIKMAYFRAKPRLLVGMLRHFPAYFDGPTAIAKAFAMAQKRALLSAKEGQTIEGVIIQQDDGYRKAGWKKHLSTGCAKVIACFPSGLAARISRILSQLEEKKCNQAQLFRAKV